MDALLRGADVQEMHFMRHAPVCVEEWSLQRDEVAWPYLENGFFPVGISSLFSMGKVDTAHARPYSKQDTL